MGYLLEGSYRIIVEIYLKHKLRLIKVNSGGEWNISANFVVEEAKLAIMRLIFTTFVVLFFAFMAEAQGRNAVVAD